MKVLICDDEPLAVERLSRLVSKMGHEVVATAHHGQDALEQARLHHPDVILLDIQMPGMNGLVCAEQLSQLNPRPAIVFAQLMISMHWRHLSHKHKLIFLSPLILKSWSRHLSN